MAHNNHNFIIPHTNGLSQDAQGSSSKIVSPTQALNGQQENLNHNSKKEQQQRKKKKCHGNRKEQHKRRRLRRQQQKATNNTNNVDHNNNDTDYSVKEQQEQIQTYSLNNHLRTKSDNKRKRQELNQNDIDINRSLSQLSISQKNNPKKKKRTRTINESNNQRVAVMNGHNNLEENNNESLPTNAIQKFKPQYLKVSDYIFKQMLSNTIKDADKIVQCLDTNEKLQFIRQMTEVTNNLHYIDLQQQLWQYYYNMGMKEGSVWTSRVTKSFAKQHHTCRTYAFPKHIIEQRQKTIQHQSQCTKNELHQYFIKLEQYSKQWQPSFDVNVLSHVINECVKKGQQRLRQEFDYKKIIFALDSNDYNLIRKFYQLQPNEEQIDLAKTIWQTTANELKMKECEEILRKRIYLQRLPSGIDKIINRSIDSIERLLSDPILDKDQCASLISTCSKTLIQYKFDLMTINLNTIQNKRHRYQELLLDLQNKVSQSNWSEIIQQTIKNRQQAMIERHETYLKHKLNTFFDEAPTASNE